MNLKAPSNRDLYLPKQKLTLSQKITSWGVLLSSKIVIKKQPLGQDFLFLNILRKKASPRVCFLIQIFDGKKGLPSIRDGIEG